MRQACPSPGLSYAVITSSPSIPGLETQRLFLAHSLCLSVVTVALCLGHSATQADQAVPVLGRMSPHKRERVTVKPQGDSHSEAAVTLLLMFFFGQSTALGQTCDQPGGKRHRTDPGGRPAGRDSECSGLCFTGPKPMLLQCTRQPQSCCVALGESLCLSGPRSLSTTSMP